MATELSDGTLVENWTTHPVNYIDMVEGVNITIQPESSGPARIDMDSVPLEGARSIRVTTWGAPKRLPESRTENGKQVYYIVSSVVKNALRERPDLVVPSGVVRDQNGRVYGCGHFSA